MNLVIVESPAKASTIKKYLGKDFEVLASFGHVRDLPKGNLGVDPENNYETKYVIPPKARKVVNAIKKEAKNSKIIYLATDLDREGEAIAWHVAEAAGLKGDVKRITFSEITKEAINDAIKHPREIDVNLVDAQQARRVLDRLVGYGLSPLLWKKIYKGLSAGRVQSVAVKMIVEREREIKAFNPDEYWLVIATLKKEVHEFDAKLVAKDGKKIDKLDIKSDKEATEVLSDLEKAKYIVENIESKITTRNPSAPYTTSNLQQDASNKLGYSPKQTMRVAQSLYEDGYITYMRTDSTNLSSQAIKESREYISSAFGDTYLPESSRMFKTKSKGAQEAHEAIRPTHPKSTPQSVSGLDSRAAKLYELIWKRTIACQMIEAKIEEARLTLVAKNYTFQANGQKIAFDGWLKVYPEKIKEMNLPALSKGDECDLVKLKKDQHFTEPPARYNEASLIKALEEYGIGRPSTYAPTISTIQDRGYVRKEDRRLFPEEIGFTVNDLLVEHFPEIVDYGFTARVEEEFDEIAEGRSEWKKMIAEFYGPFSKKLVEKMGSIEKKEVNTETGEECPDCGKPLQMKRSRYGQFIGCSGFPDCKYMKPFINEKEQEKLDEAEAQIGDRSCPDCKGKLFARKGKYGIFIGCKNYPKCKYIEKVRVEKPAEATDDTQQGPQAEAKDEQNKEGNEQTS